MIFQEGQGGYSSISFERVDSVQANFTDVRGGRNTRHSSAASALNRLGSGPQIVSKKTDKSIFLRKRIPYREDWENWLFDFVDSGSYIVIDNGVEVKAALVPGNYVIKQEGSDLIFLAQLVPTARRYRPNNIN